MVSMISPMISSVSDAHYVVNTNHRQGQHCSIMRVPTFGQSGILNHSELINNIVVYLGKVIFGFLKPS